MTKIEALELEAAARRMVEGAKLEWWEVIKHYGCVNHMPLTLQAPRNEYELALGIVEGKPVWEGDLLYYPKYEHAQRMTALIFNKYEWSWNPPKPKTVMVELPTTVAFAMTATKITGEIPVYHFTVSDLQIMSEACRKALDGMK